MEMTRHQVDGSKGNTGLMEQKGTITILGDLNGEVLEVRIHIFLQTFVFRLSSFYVTLLFYHSYMLAYYLSYKCIWCSSNVGRLNILLVLDLCLFEHLGWLEN